VFAREVPRLEGTCFRISGGVGDVFSASHVMSLYLRGSVLSSMLVVFLTEHAVERWFWEQRG